MFMIGVEVGSVPRMCISKEFLLDADVVDPGAAYQELSDLSINNWILGKKNNKNVQLHWNDDIVVVAEIFLKIIQCCRKIPILQYCKVHLKMYVLCSLFKEIQLKWKEEMSNVRKFKMN